jgi:hypothetical protein
LEAGEVDVHNRLRIRQADKAAAKNAGLDILSRRRQSDRTLRQSSIWFGTG